VLALSLASGHAWRALTEKELYPFRDLGYREIGEEESNVSTRELAKSRSCDKEFGVRPLVISVVVT
jgi:hypothetical protein